MSTVLLQPDATDRLVISAACCARRASLRAKVEELILSCITILCVTPKVSGLNPQVSQSASDTCALYSA